MRYRLRVGRRAERQIREASDWWYENRLAAPELFKTELQRAFELITTHPQVGQPSLGARSKDVRRVLLGRVRYHLYYRLLERQGAVEVLALWHSSRGSSPTL